MFRAVTNRYRSVKAQPQRVARSDFPRHAFQKQTSVGLIVDHGDTVMSQRRQERPHGLSVPTSDSAIGRRVEDQRHERLESMLRAKSSVDVDRQPQSIGQWPQGVHAATRRAREQMTRLDLHQ